MKTIENITEKAINQTKKLKKEIRTTVVTAITAAFGFLIALSWRDVITGYVNKITSISPFQGQVFSAITVTLICVLGILIVSKLAIPKEK